MIQITPQSKILFYTEPIDFRKGIDTLCGLVRKRLGHDPFCGYVFVFYNRRKTSLKILVYDGQGFWLMMKRLSRGRFRSLPGGGSALRSLLSYEMMILIHNGNYNAASLQPVFHAVNR